MFSSHTFCALNFLFYIFFASSSIYFSVPKNYSPPNIQYNGIHRHTFRGSMLQLFYAASAACWLLLLMMMMVNVFMRPTTPR